MSGEQARDYGIVDGVLEKRGQLPQLGQALMRLCCRIAQATG